MDWVSICADFLIGDSSSYVGSLRLSNFSQNDFVGPVVITGLETMLLVMALTPFHTVE